MFLGLRFPLLEVGSIRNDFFLMKISLFNNAEDKKVKAWLLALSETPAQVLQSRKIIS